MYNHIYSNTKKWNLIAWKNVINICWLIKEKSIKMYSTHSL